MSIVLTDTDARALTTLLDRIGASLEEVGALLTARSTAHRAVGLVPPFEIVATEPFTDFEYRWPNGMVRYIDAQRYTVRRDDADYVFALGAEKGGRASYQRDDRGRLVAFVRSRTSESSYYPLVEFAESDQDPDVYAAIVPRPSAPRSGATGADLEELRTIPHLRDARLKSADEVFTSVRNGPSLRLLVRRDDPRLMIEHAWWVGTMRGTTG